jgi:hypothetical protein
MSNLGGNQPGAEGSPVLQEFDHYDFINAPQFVDFSDLAQNDDPNADVFFGEIRSSDACIICYKKFQIRVYM